MMALNFCLALRPPLLKLRPELISILQESLQIAEADESVLNGKFMNPKMAATLTKLRTVCIELLCTAMAWADFKTQSHADLRSRIIAMFFKSLTCRTPEIVAVAKEGLRQVCLPSHQIVLLLLIPLGFVAEFVVGNWNRMMHNIYSYTNLAAFSK